MPFIQVSVPFALSPDVKAKLVRDVVDRTHEAVGSDPAIINVVIHELSAANISVGGKVHDEPS
ncbi:tautomerase family protein [Amycolatopsis kentuckyensis]|uniref:tautomerase family protein n=1 Tax=Amycolatopsis kentuckyensis TaxID=218823 RepID=UPI00356818D0